MQALRARKRFLRPEPTGSRANRATDPIRGGGEMTTTIEREIHQTTKPGRPAPLLLKRRVSAGEPEQRFARGRSQPMAVEVRGRASPIRAWRAAETDPSPTPRQEDRAAARVAAAAPRQPFGREAGAGARLDAIERAARMRAIEQAWKEEVARQAELEAD